MICIHYEIILNLPFTITIPSIIDLDLSLSRNIKLSCYYYFLQHMIGFFNNFVKPRYVNKKFFLNYFTLKCYAILFFKVIVYWVYSFIILKIDFVFDERSLVYADDYLLKVRYISLRMELFINILKVKWRP